jgi:hypothetical protein
VPRGTAGVEAGSGTRSGRPASAWLLFPLLVGLGRTLDAGCAFMLISVGVVLVVSAAQNGPGSLLP